MMAALCGGDGVRWWEDVARPATRELAEWRRRRVLLVDDGAAIEEDVQCLAGDGSF